MAPEGISEHKCRMVWLYWYEVIDGINGIYIQGPLMEISR